MMYTLAMYVERGDELVCRVHNFKSLRNCMRWMQTLSEYNVFCSLQVLPV